MTEDNGGSLRAVYCTNSFICSASYVKINQRHQDAKPSIMAALKNSVLKTVLNELKLSAFHTAGNRRGRESDEISVEM